MRIFDISNDIFLLLDFCISTLLIHLKKLKTTFVNFKIPSFEMPEKRVWNSIVVQHLEDFKFSRHDMNSELSINRPLIIK